MKPRVFSAFAVLLSLAAAPAAGAAAVAGEGVTITTGKVLSDAAGASVMVSARNPTAETIPELEVNCTFYAGRRALGSAGTRILSTPPGGNRSDQVRLLGATSATRVACALKP